MRVSLEEAQANLTVAQNRAREQANRSRREELFHVGDKVLLSTRHIRVDQHLPSKLRRRFIGPYKVTERISSVAYRLELPPTWKIHYVFHVANLKRFRKSEEFNREDVPPPPIIVEGEEEYEVDSILRHKGQGARRLYLVVWKGYPITEASWEPESNLRNASRLLEEYLRRFANDQRDQRRRNRERN